MSHDCSHTLQQLHDVQSQGKMASKKHQVYPVRDLAVLVEKHPSAYLGEDELKKLSVDVVPMDLYTGIPADGQQQFCKPYPREQFDKIFEERKDSIDWERCGMLHKANHTDSQPKSIGFHDYDAYDDATYTEYMLDELLFGGPKLSNKCEYRFRGYGNASNRTSPEFSLLIVMLQAHAISF